MMVAAGADLQNLVAALDAALLPCLPARELQAADRSTHPSHQVDVERHARDFMETAKSLQLFFIKAQHQHKPTREEALRKVSPSFFFWFLEKHMIGSSMIVERRLVDLFFAADACCLDVLVKNHYLGVCLLKVLSSENCQL
jgi:hypothetical protein